MIGASTDLALRAFEARPQRLEALADLARFYRDRGMNETAAMLAIRGVGRKPPEDLLFVEIGAYDELITTLTICGYYSKDSQVRSHSHAICEQTALDRTVSRETCETARRNLFWYAPKLIELAPSFRSVQINFSSPPNWYAMNPSVVLHQGKLRGIMRCVNYWIEPDGSYQFRHTEPAISTRNFLVEFDPPHVVSKQVEIIPDLGPVLYPGVLGLEDLRLFTWNDELRFIAAARQMNHDGWVEQVTGRLSLDGVISDMEVVRQAWRQACEKNWMPIIGAEHRFSEPHFVYRCDPTTLVALGMTREPERRPAPIAADNFSGSSQLIPFDGGWLCMTHEPLASPMNGRRLNQQRFVQFNDNFNIIAVSRRFIFALNEEIEYVVGLCRHPGNGSAERFIISYGSHDRQAWTGSIDVSDVRAMLNPIAPPSLSVINSSNPSSDLKSPAQLFPSWSARPSLFTPPDGYAAMGTSVILRGQRLIASVRCINYAVGDRDGTYYRISDRASMGGHVKPRSRTFLLEIDPDTLTETVLGELSIGIDFPPPLPATLSYGFEDLRLFEWRGLLWGISAFAEQSIDGLPEQWMVRIDDDLKIQSAQAIFPQGLPRRAEKNWMPLIGTSPPRFIYLCDPTTILDFDGNIVARSDSEVPAADFRGGSQAIPFDGGWLAITHVKRVFDDQKHWVDFKYINRFVWFDEQFRLRKASSEWWHPVDAAVSRFAQNFQLAAGLAWHPDGRRLVIGFELYEREPWMATVDAEDVRRTLGSEVVLMRPIHDDDGWALAQTNQVLQDRATFERATHLLKLSHLPEHAGSPEKNWDTWIAIRHCLDNCQPDKLVLDAGGGGHSSFLRAMKLLGYSDLLNVNIDEPSPGIENGIKYQAGDITNLHSLSSQSVHFVLCQSVIEHGVDWPAFCREMTRILVPDGRLFLSTDYWETPIRPEIFTPVGIQDMIDIAASSGLSLVGPVNYRCRDACVDWSGWQYTFINLLFRRDS